MAAAKSTDPADVFRAAREHRAAQSYQSGPKNSDDTNQAQLAKAQHSLQGSRPQAKELEDLKIKIRVLEGRRVEDAERIKSLEAKALEAETQAQTREKLRTRFLEMQQELATQRRQNKETEKVRVAAEAREAELLDQLEMLALDKEMAEEKAESAASQIEQLEETIEGIKLEVQVLQTENAKYEKPIQPGDEERSSVAFVQLEKQNERLKEALVRLRDMSSETERNQKARIAELEKDNNSNEDLCTQLEEVRSDLVDAEIQIEDLKQQLDSALGAEEMLEQLTEKTLTMGETIEEMRIHIEDLEAIKEMNDEMEQDHIENEKHLDEAVEVLGARIREQQQREYDLEALVADREDTILQFRDLVQGIQAELNDLRAKHDLTEAETANLSTQSQAMLNMNLKLQSSASKSQAKMLDLDLAHLEARICKEHVYIIQVSS